MQHPKVFSLNIFEFKRISFALQPILDAGGISMEMNNIHFLEEMMKERGVDVDHTTLHRWVMKYANELKKRSSWYTRNHAFSWRHEQATIYW